MAVPAGTFQSYQAIGVREDLEDMIYDVSPTETPFLTMAAKSKAKQTLHEWQTDALAAPGTNAAIEGDDAPSGTSTPTARLANRCQILTKSARVSGTQEANDSAGRASEMAYQMLKRSKELKRDLEYALTRNQAASAGGAGTARTMAGIETWIATNKTSVGTGTAQTTPGTTSGAPTTAPTDSTIAGSVAESHLRTGIRLAYAAGGEPGTLLVGPATKQKISGSFNGIATRYKDVPKGKAQIVSGVDVYVSDFGDHQLVPSRIVRDQNILGLDMDYWSVAYFRPFQTKQLASTGDYEAKQITVEATLVCKNELANFKITDINPAL